MCTKVPSWIKIIYLFIFLLTKQEILLGNGTRVESSRVREPRRTALPRGSQFYGDGVVFGQSL